jgi:hypothetical protein
MKSFDEAQSGNPPHMRQMRRDSVQRAGRRAGGVLWIQGHHENLFAIRGAQAIQRIAHTRLSVAHPDFHQAQVGRESGGFQPLAEIAVQQRLLLDAVDQERRAVLGPDGAVSPGGLGGARDQNDPVQDRDPHRWGNLDDPRIDQELRQVAAHRRRRWRIGRAQVDQQYANAGDPVVRKGRFGRVRH